MNYHLFVVDQVSLKYHIEYAFVGTGNSSSNFNVSLWKDIVSLKIDDVIVFYVQGIKKFYGFFKVASLPFYDSNHYLQPYPLPFLGKKKNTKLCYRALIKPYIVFEKGIDEFDLIDILPQETRNILWSILYRKLKGARGCSPIFPNEFKIIYQKISQINNNYSLPGNNFTFSNSKIEANKVISPQCNTEIDFDNGSYIVRNNILKKKYTEHHLHALLIKHTPNLIFGNNISWLGNEVYSGAGTQAIDILTINSNNVFSIVEIKKNIIPSDIIEQIKKYILWLQNRFSNHNSNHFQPVIIGGKTGARNIRIRRDRKSIFENFNNQTICLPIKYFEYEIIDNNIKFYKINYFDDWNSIGEQTI